MSDYINRLGVDGTIIELIPDPLKPGFSTLKTPATVICTWRLSAIVLDTIPEWTDKDKFLELQGSSHDLITGETIVQAFERLTKGMPITLLWDGKNGALLTSTVATLRTLANLGNSFVFHDGTTNYTVVFDYSKDNPIDMEFLDVNQVIMKGTIYLRRAS
jgi:hypothetical protein